MNITDMSSENTLSKNIGILLNTVGFTDTLKYIFLKSLNRLETKILQLNCAVLVHLILK